MAWSIAPGESSFHCTVDVPAIAKGVVTWAQARLGPETDCQAEYYNTINLMIIQNIEFHHGPSFKLPVTIIFI